MIHSNSCLDPCIMAGGLHDWCMSITPEQRITAFDKGLKAKLATHTMNELNNPKPSQPQIISDLLDIINSRMRRGTMTDDERETVEWARESLSPESPDIIQGIRQG